MTTTDEMKAAIDDAGAPPMMTELAKKLLVDALSRKASKGAFDMYAAFSCPDGQHRLIGNPIGDKQGFLRIMQIVGVALSSQVNAIVSESWYLDPDILTPEEYKQAESDIHAGMRVSQHPRSVETIVVHLKDDDASMLIVATLKRGSNTGETTAFSAACTGRNAEAISGEMTDTRATPQIAALMRSSPGLLPTRSQVDEISMDWANSQAN